MFLAVVILALSCAGTMYRTRLWASGIFSLTLVFFVVALLRTIRLSGRERIAAAVFSTAGISYLLVATVGFFHGASELLVTNYPLAWGAQALNVPSPPNSAGPNPYAVTLAGQPTTATTLTLTPAPVEWDTASLIDLGTSPQETNDPVRHFFVIGHCLFACLFAVLGGWFAERMYDRRKVPASA
jgi:hypothetical protein